MSKTTQTIIGADGSEYPVCQFSAMRGPVGAPHATNRPVGHKYCKNHEKMMMMRTINESKKANEEHRKLLQEAQEHEWLLYNQARQAEIDRRRMEEDRERFRQEHGMAGSSEPRSRSSDTSAREKRDNPAKSERRSRKDEAKSTDWRSRSQNDSDYSDAEHSSRVRLLVRLLVLRLLHHLLPRVVLTRLNTRPSTRLSIRLVPPLLRGTRLFLRTSHTVRTARTMHGLARSHRFTQVHRVRRLNPVLLTLLVHTLLGRASSLVFRLSALLLPLPRSYLTCSRRSSVILQYRGPSPMFRIALSTLPTSPCRTPNVHNY